MSVSSAAVDSLRIRSSSVGRSVFRRVRHQAAGRSYGEHSSLALAKLEDSKRREGSLLSAQVRVYEVATRELAKQVSHLALTQRKLVTPISDLVTDNLFFLMGIFHQQATVNVTVKANVFKLIC